MSNSRKGERAVDPGKSSDRLQGAQVKKNIDSCLGSPMMYGSLLRSPRLRLVTAFPGVLFCPHEHLKNTLRSSRLVQFIQPRSFLLLLPLRNQAKSCPRHNTIYFYFFISIFSFFFMLLSFSLSGGRLTSHKLNQIRGKRTSGPACSYFVMP